MTAPATAPTGPKTTTPDNAPSAASPTRSPASVADGTHQIAIAAATTIFFMLCLPALHARGAVRFRHFRPRKNCFLLPIFGKIRAVEEAQRHVNTNSAAGGVGPIADTSATPRDA